MQLEYKLYGSGEFLFETASDVVSYAKRFEEALAGLNSLREAHKAPNLLAYILFDCPDGCKPSDLTGPNLAQARYLQERCSNLGMPAYLAQMHETRHKYSLTVGEHLSICATGG